jgi:hypothetical protein
MATIYNRKTTGLFPNGGGQLGDNTNFTWFTSYTTDSLSNGRSFFWPESGGYGSTKVGSTYIPVDTSKNYQIGCAVRGINVSVGGTSYSGQHSGGHIGFVCYDLNNSHCTLQGQKGIGQTTLTRACSATDAKIYVADASGWYNGTTASSSYASFYPAGTDYDINVGHTTKYDQYDTQSVTDIGGGEWTVDFTTGLATGFNYPIGTPVCNGRSGGTYNYAIWDSASYPSVWTALTSPVFTGESRNSSTPFRFGTKSIRFMTLVNYRHRSDSPTTWPEYAIDNILLVERPDGTALPDSFFLSDRIK